MPLPDAEPLSGEIVEESVVLSVADLSRMIAASMSGISSNWWRKACSACLQIDAIRMALQRCGAAPRAHRAASGARSRASICPAWRSRSICWRNSNSCAANASDRDAPMSAPRIRCLRLLRRDRRSGLQEDLSRAARHGAAGRPADSDHRHGARRLESRTAARARAREPGECRRIHRGRLREARRRSCATSTATTRTRRPIRRCARSSARGPPDPLSCHSAEHVRAAWSRGWRNPAARTTRG